MKKLWFISLFAVAALFNACQKDSQETTDDLLARQIAFSEDKTPIAPADLPPSVAAYVEENHFETYIESAFRVPERGYEVILGNEDVVYCDRTGRVLRPKRGPFRDGPCGHGEPVGLDAIPAAIVQYVADNYPDAQIHRAKLVETDEGGIYFIKIDNPNYILIFKENGEFVEATVLFFHCRPLGTPIDLGALPETITSYIEENFPGAEIKVAFHKNNGMYIVGIFTPDGRKIVGFDTDGSFLFVRP